MSAQFPETIGIGIGIDLRISDLSEFVTESIAIRLSEKKYIEIENSLEIYHIHGTVVSLIIRDLCPYVRIRSINIIDENLTDDGLILLFAIEHAFDDPPDIIHLSRGTTC